MKWHDVCGFQMSFCSGLLVYQHVSFKLFGRSCTQNECELKGLSVSNHSRLNTEEHLSHLILLGPVTEANLSNQL